MTRVRLEDLPPKLRKQVEARAEEASTPAGEAAGPTPRRASRDLGPRYRCHDCGEVFDHYGAAAERHADSHGGARLDAVLGGR